MNASFPQVLIALLTGIILIIFCTSRWRIHPFFALLLACFVVGGIVQMPVADIISTAKDGFGNILKSLGFIIILGTALGVLLERNGSTRVMAEAILKMVGRKYPALAMSITGLIVGLPIFCDSGFIVLSGLNYSLAKRTGTHVVVMAVSMATGLYAVHCMVPPHPGAAAAASLIGVPFGKMIIFGLIAAVPAMFAAYMYTSYAGKKLATANVEESVEPGPAFASAPSPLRSFLPVVVPIVLIAARSVAPEHTPVLSVLGDPVMALIAGVLLALSATRRESLPQVNSWLQEAVEKAGGILVIIGAGGAFGAILGATHIGEHFSRALPLAGMGLAFPFLLTALLKTAQGSSTVAIIAASAIVQPLLAQLGLEEPSRRLLCVLAMGAGSMMVSHANDAYFWVISKFEKIEMPVMLKVYSVSTLIMGLVSFAVVYLLSLIV